jgi:hypothetical protein
VAGLRSTRPDRDRGRAPVRQCPADLQLSQPRLRARRLASAIPADNGWRRREEVGNEVARGVLQRETGDSGTVRHRGAAPSGSGRVGPTSRLRER